MATKKSKSTKGAMSPSTMKKNMGFGANPQGKTTKGKKGKK
jgi:hypothetical protein